MRIHALLIVGMLSLVSGCSDDNSPSESSQTLDGARLAGPVWELTQYTGPDGGLRDVLPVTTFQFRLAPNSSNAQSFSQCTGQSGSYVIGDGFVSLRFDGSVEDVVCEPSDDAAFSEQSLAVRAILDGKPPGEVGEIGSTLTYRIDGNALALIAPDGRQLMFVQVDTFEDELPGGSSEAAELLLNQTWGWDGYQASFDEEVEPTDHAFGEYTLRFSADGTVGGDLGCNGWNGNWMGPGVSLEITRVIASEAYCGAEAQATADVYLDALQSASGLSVLVDELQLFVFAADGVRLRFSPYQGPTAD